MTTLPTVHAGGTSAEDLYFVHECALDMVRRTIAALCSCTPNARDYIGPDASHLQAKATAEHVARLRALDSIADELLQILSHLSNHLPGTGGRA